MEVFMIVEGLIGILKVLLNILLAPIGILSVPINFVASIPIVSTFLRVVAYILPWSNIQPLIIFIVAIFTFRIAISVFFFIKNAVFNWL